jgi:hypothetical protein
MHRSKRPLLVAASLACFAAAAVLAPTGARSQLDFQPRPSPDAAGATTAPPPVAIAPERDAFAPRAALDEDPRPPLPVPPVPLPPLRPLTVTNAPPRPVAVSRVTAIVTGAQPAAIVDTGTGLRLVTTGDALDGSTIAAIDDDGVRLTDGRRRSLEPAPADR